MSSFVPGSKVAVRGILIMGMNFYYLVDDHPLPYGNNGSLDPGTFEAFGDLITVTCKVIGLNCRKATPPTWTSPTTSGDSPGARFGHSAVMDGTGKMWIFGGDRNGGRLSWMVSRSGLDAF